MDKLVLHLTNPTVSVHRKRRDTVGVKGIRYDEGCPSLLGRIATRETSFGSDAEP